MSALPPMPEDWEDTRATLHAYAESAAALPRALAPPDDKFWHVAMTVEPDGLTSKAIPMPDGGTAAVLMDLGAHQVVLATSDGREWAWPMDDGISATKLADALIDTAAELGLSGDYDRERFENDDPRPYDPAAAAQFYEVLAAVGAVFAVHRSHLEGEVSPIHMWPHGFDLSFEWFGTRVEQFEEDGELVDYSSQINLGFYPAGEPYFYSNPWPFDVDELIDNPLPEGCGWYVEDWNGSRLPYKELKDDETATERLAEYASRVFEVAQPTLTT